MALLDYLGRSIYGFRLALACIISAWGSAAFPQCILLISCQEQSFELTYTASTWRTRAAGPATAAGR